MAHPAETAAAHHNSRQNFAYDDRQPQPPKTCEKQWHEKRQGDDD